MKSTWVFIAALPALIVCCLARAEIILPAEDMILAVYAASCAEEALSAFGVTKSRYAIHGWRSCTSLNSAVFINGTVFWPEKQHGLTPKTLSPTDVHP